MATFKVPVRIEGPMLPGPAFNIFHIRNQVGEEENDAIDQFLIDIEAFYDSLERMYPQSLSFILGEGIIRDPYGAPTYMADRTKTVSLGAAAAPAAAFQALTVSWRTTSATRSGRGRTFLGPVGRDLTEGNGTPDSICVSEARAAAVALVGKSVSPLRGWSLGVFSVQQGVLRDVTGSSVADRWSYLSSRRD